METYKNKTLGVEVLINVPSSLNEAAQMFGEKAVRIAAIRQTCYGPWNNKFKEAFCEELGKETGTPRRPLLDSEGKPKTKKNRKGEEVVLVEKEKDYVMWLISREENPVSLAELHAIAQRVADTVEFKIEDVDLNDEPDAEFVKIARVILARIQNNAVNEQGETASEELFVSKWNAANGRDFYSLGEFNEMTVARALEIDDNRRKASMVDSLL